MKLSTATLIFAVTALAAPAAVGQSQGIAFESGSSFLAAGPDPEVAWLTALGFLGLVVARRTRS